MTVASRRRWRWVAPVGAVALVAAGTFAANTVAHADPGLPPRSAQQLVTDVLQADVPGLSGTVSETADLGLPSLTGLGGDAGDLQGWLTGSHTARVWSAGDDKQRIAVPDGTDETDVIRNGTTTWVWNSADQTATRSTVPAGKPGRPSTDVPPTPQQAAQQLLAAVGKVSTVSTASNSTVAGRAAYELTVTPAQSGSKIAKVELAIDGTTHVPLQVQVFAAGAAKPAVQIGFTSVDFAVPADSTFAFTPPKGATVKQQRANDHAAAGHRPDGTTSRVVGTGWTSVLVAKTGVSSAQGKEAGEARQQLNQALGQLPKVSGAWGSGRLFSGPLFSAVITDDGRVAVGAVQPELLYAALG